MSKLAIIIGVLIVSAFLWSRFIGGWKKLHQKLIGLSATLFGIYLATLTGTVTQFVIPGLGAIGGGAAAGAGVGFVTWLFIGTVGVATGGSGIAVWAISMSIIGSLFGVAGAASGGAGFQTVSYPLVTPWFWVPLVILGIYLIAGSSKNVLNTKSI